MMSSDGTLLISAHHWNNIPTIKHYNATKVRILYNFISYFMQFLAKVFCLKIVLP